MRSVTSSLILSALTGVFILTAIPVSAKPQTTLAQVTIADTAPFPNRLVASHPPSKNDFDTLGAMMDEYRRTVPPANLAVIERYLKAEPNSPWRLALRVNLGALYYEGGYFAKAINAYDAAWHRDGKTVTNETRPLRDAAIGELARMHARLGHADELQKIFDEIGDQPLYGSASEAVAGAREGLWQMRNNHGVAYRCGPAALSSIIEASREGSGASTPSILRVGDKARARLRDYPSGVNGVSMDQVTALADGAGMGLVAARRVGDAAIPLPAVVHWKVDHYAALVAERDGLYHVKDPTFGRDLWISKEAIDSESSGVFLIPKDKVRADAGWTRVSTAETRKLYGRGYVSTGDQDDSRDDSDMDDDNNQCPRGMCVPNVASMLVSLRLNDVPVGYQPPKGPSVFTKVTYNQREASQPATLNFFNVGPKWTLNWLSYIEDSPTSAGASTKRYAAGGGEVEYSGYNSSTGAFTREERAGAQLVRTSASPIRYERRLRDGSKEVYGASNGATAYPRRVFLTQIVDASGNALTLNYDGSMRVTQIVDAIGQTTTVSYQHATNPLLVTRITDPFGRYASFDYDSSGRLSRITDTIGISSAFTYDAATFITAMTTPYGTTSFVATTSSTKRSINITDPMGYTRRTEFIDQSPGLPFSEPTPAGISTFQYLYYRNTHHWDGEAYARSPSDYTKTRVKHWLHGKTTSMLAGVLDSTKNPLETRVWHYYPGQSGAGYNAGTTLDLPAKSARLLPDGSTQLASKTYTAAGNPSGDIDAVGRETQSTYDSTGVDLLNVKRKVGSTFETIAAYTYNSQHRPLTYTDQAGQTWAMTYNVAGQLLTVTNPKGETTTRNYNGNGYLTSITNANGQTAASFTYDAVGRVLTETDAGGYTKTHGYDNLDRLVTTTYPDGTTTVNTWTALDLTTVKDRLGRVTRYEYNANRKLVKITDPAGLVTQYAYDRANRLISLTDPNGSATQWERDIQGRVTAKVFPDNTRIQIAYDTAGRVASVTDALGQVRQYGYVKDDRLLSVAYANAVNPTPSVTYSWDAFFPRLASMIDGIGTTTYAYHATGTLGAGKLATEAGPFGAPSTVAYIYDPLGRVLTRNAGGSVETFGYDTLGRSVSDANDLGTFRYSYLGQTAQVTDQTVDGGNYKLTYTYEPNAGDRRLKRIQNRNLLNLLDAKDYHYKTDAEGRITAETLAVSLATTFEYDDSDRLLSDKRAALSRDDYEYDDAGNLIFQRKGLNTWDATANANNQLSAAGGVAWTYDATGNLLNDGKRSYLWDAQYRLIQIKNLDTGSISDISYDGLDRRTVMSERASEGATPVVSRYLWCGEEICQRRNGADVVQALYFTQGEIKNGTSLFYAKDQLGSIKNVANKNGNWLGTLNYTAYGEVKQRTGQVLPDRQYAGMFQHAPSGLNLTWYRGYDPIAGRWLARDPIGETGGINLYGYVGGNPVNFSDPEGLNPAAGAMVGAEIGTMVFPGPGTIVGGVVGAGIGAWLGWNVVGPMLSTPPDNAYDPKGPKAPGMPSPEDGFVQPKGGPNWVPNPNPGKGGSSHGWEDANGDVWCPTGQGGRAHGGPHWDVQSPGGGNRNVRPRR